MIILNSTQLFYNKYNIFASKRNKYLIFSCFFLILVIEYHSL